MPSFAALSRTLFAPLAGIAVFMASPAPLCAQARGGETSAQAEPVLEAPPQPSEPSAAPSAAPPAPPEEPLLVEAEFGRGVTLRRRDERGSINLRARLQARATMVWPNALREGEAPASGEFLVRRMRLVVSGTALTPRLRYYLQLGFATLDMEPDLLVPLRDAHVTYAGLRDLSVRVGQMKVPFARQRVISSGALQFVDRSIVNAELNLDRDVGVQLLSEDLFGLGHRLGYQAGIFSGNGRNRGGLDPHFLYVARVQAQPLGRFEDADHESDLRRGPPRLSLGLGVAYNPQSNRAFSTHGARFREARFDYMHAEVDLLFKWAGFSLLAEGLYRRATEDEHRSTTSDGVSLLERSRSALGYMVQLAYQLPQRVELGARWAQVLPFAGTDTLLRPQHELGLVTSWYFAQHALKLQGDYFYLFEEDPTLGRHQLRVQLQVFF